MNEAKIYADQADKLFWRYKRQGGILILHKLRECRDTLDRYSKLKSLGKTQTKRYNEIKKFIDELEEER